MTRMFFRRHAINLKDYFLLNLGHLLLFYKQFLLHTGNLYTEPWSKKFSCSDKLAFDFGCILDTPHNMSLCVCARACVHVQPYIQVIIPWTPIKEIFLQWQTCIWFWLYFRHASQRVCVCVCVCVRARARVCVRVRARVCSTSRILRKSLLPMFTLFCEELYKTIKQTYTALYTSWPTSLQLVYAV
jgi:hypothetical protein